MWGRDDGDNVGVGVGVGDRKDVRRTFQRYASTIEKYFCKRAKPSCSSPYFHFCKVEPLARTARHGSRAFEPRYIFNWKVEARHIIVTMRFLHFFIGFLVVEKSNVFFSKFFTIAGRS